jgi:LuxR family transcriptional regulator, maltose regulon positive regulatory protein
MSTKSIPISKTKIIVPPRRPELLSRPRLLEGLSGLLDNKLVLLSAPAGYGKTSLLIDLAHGAEMTVCWLSLDLLDRDPQRFIAYLIASLSARFPGVGATSRLQLNQLKSMEQDAEGLLITLTNELYEQTENDFLLIIDDYHLVDDVPAIAAFLNRFLELVLENCHIILSSRTLPALEDVTVMVAREQVAGLSQDELAFVPREVQALYAQNYHQHLSEEAADQIVEQTRGWVTGMLLSNLSGATRVSGVDTFTYLGNQVLNHQPGHVREFLMRTSLPEEFNTEFCEIVLGPLHSRPQNWSELMALIFEKNLFVLPLEDGRWLRYHPLFREFLQDRLKKERPHEIQPILERMVTAYEKAGEWEKAYFTCRQLNDIESLAGVVERAGTPMLQSALVTLEGWINSLPPAMLRNRPGLISLRGPILAMKGNLHQSKELLDKAIAIYRRDNNTPGLLLALIRRANTLRISGNYTASLEDVRDAHALTEADAQFQIHYPEILRLKGLNLFRLGEARQALEALEHSLSLFTALNETSRLPTILMETGMVHGEIGDIESARLSYDKALKLKKAEGDLFTQAEIMNNLGVLYHQLGEYELASEMFESALTCARKSRNQRAEGLILTSLGDLYGEVEEYDVALESYQQAEIIASGLSGFFISNYLIIARVALALSQGNVEKAATAIKLLRKRMKGSQSAYERSLWNLIEARFYLLKVEPKKAIPLLKDCKSFFTRDGRNLESLSSVIWLVAAYEQAGRRNDSYEEVRDLLSASTAVNHGLLVTIRQASPWLRELQNDKQIGRQLGGLLEKSQRLSARLPSIRRALRRHAQSIQMPPAGLSIRAFGRAEVTVNGRLVTMSDWRTQSVRDLFFFFLLNQEMVTKEQLWESLWPETEDPQVLKARFKNEIYRLRRAAGRNVIVFEEEYYCFNRSLDYEYDVEAFDSHILRARKSEDKTSRIGHLQKAVDLVAGPYLVDVDAFWAIPERERLNQVYVLALEELAQLYLETNQLDRCLKICQAALRKDPYHEVIYQVEMRVYAALGDRASIARRYQACKKALRDGLGLSPSNETELIYRDLSK